MTLVCGWLPSADTTLPTEVVEAMGRALRVRCGQGWACWSVPGLAVGLLEIETEPSVQLAYAPAVCPEGRCHLWLAGEAFDGRRLLNLSGPTESRTLAFRRALLEALLEKGPDAIGELDGEYV